MDSIDRGVAHAMWHVLRQDIIQQWRHETGANPDMSELQITVYNFHGALEVRFHPEVRRVRLTLRHYDDVQDWEEVAAEYEMGITPEGERYWERGNFRHGQEGMGRLMIYHLLKYRAPEGAFVLVER